MKVFLMYRDCDFDLQLPSPANEAVVVQDLDLDTLFTAMAAKDPLVFEVAKKAILTAAANDVDVIEYRQAALKDCMGNPDIVGQLYDLAVESAERQRKIWSTFREYPSGLLDTSVQRMVAFIDVLKRVRALVDRNAGEFRSEAFTRLFTTLSTELDDDYFAVIDRHLNRLKFRAVLVSAGLGKGLRGVDYVVRRAAKGPGQLVHPRLPGCLRGRPGEL
jgi:hypothetical protein